MTLTLHGLLASMHAVSIPHDVHVTLTKEYLLVSIDSAAQAATESLSMDPNYLMGTVVPRGKTRFPWREHQTPLWRLDTELLLWIDAEGVIYEGYDVMVWDGHEDPDYLMRADLENWSIHGLQQVLDAVRALAA